MAANLKTVTTSGKRKSARATVTAQQSDNFSIKVNNYNLEIHTNKLMKDSISEVCTIIGEQYLTDLSFDIKVRGGGCVSTIEASKQAFCKAVIAYYGTYHTEVVKQELKERLQKFDKNIFIADARRVEPKKVGGPGARAKYQKSYR